MCRLVFKKLLLQSHWYFCNITESGWFWKRLPRNKGPNNYILKPVWKSNYSKSIAELWAVISDWMIKYQLPNTPLDQVSYYKHDVYLYGKLSTKQLQQAANKNNRSNRLHTFFKSGVLENFAKLTRKHLFWSLFLIKLQAWRPVKLC